LGKDEVVIMFYVSLGPTQEQPTFATNAMIIWRALWEVIQTKHIVRTVQYSCIGMLVQYLAKYLAVDSNVITFAATYLTYM